MNFTDNTTTAATTEAHHLGSLNHNLLLTTLHPLTTIHSSGPPHVRPTVHTEGGIFSGASVLSSPLALFLVQATIIISLSHTLHFFLKKLRQPRVISEIIGGICLGPSVLGNIPGFTETIFPKHSLGTLSLISSFGLVMYMFLMGLELDTSVLSRGVKRFLIIGIAGIILPGILGTAVSFGIYNYLLEPEKQAITPFPSFLLFTFVAMSITAFPVLARILTEKKLLNTTVGLMSISAAAINDIFAWILLALVISIINAQNPFNALYVLITCGAFAAFLLFPVRLLLHKIAEKFGNNNHILTQVVFAVIFAMIFLAAWTTEFIGVHAIFGAFLIGIIIPRIGGITIELTEKLEDLVGIALLPLYFASSGLKTNIGLLSDWLTLLFLILVVFVACAGKIAGCLVAARYANFDWRESISIGVLMNTKGLVELIVLNIGLDAGAINDRIFVIMVLMALITTFMTSPIIAYVYPAKYQQKIAPAGTEKKLKRASSKVQITWPNMDDKILVYLRDLDSIPLVSDILQMFRASLAPGKSILMNGFKAFTDFERSSNIMVSTQTEHVIENDPTLKVFRFFGKLIGANTNAFIATSRTEEIGGEIDKIASKEHCELIIIPWKQDVSGNDQQEAVRSILNSVNHTSAIFVNRHPAFPKEPQPKPMLSDTPFKGIIVPFLGGLNDRTALQLACRFHNIARVPIMILHLTVSTSANFNKLDNDLLKASKDLGKENGVTYKEEKVSKGDFKPILEALKTDKYDLVIVGHDIKSQRKPGFLTALDDSKEAISVVRRFSFRPRKEQEISDEERIFGTLGAMLYMVPKVPSMLIVHDPIPQNGTDAA